ncbi:cornifelin-like [Boleophthalmus pectinirostris]|uniref:cornifelin-like n=1 Tax=Boleophthalmus pectinirostris TaxID=150288 RepID=UPI000A1C22C5|nr:cornifelin-like [Boleophthalmus pectinirostris]
MTLCLDTVRLLQARVQSERGVPLHRMKRSVTVQPQSEVFMRDASEWSTGLCHCCRDCKDCCRSFCCFPCLSCQTANRHGACLCLPLLDMCGFIHPIAMTLRATTRERYSIRGSFCVDCLLSTCCCPCVYCQVHRELQHRQLPSMLGDIVQRK